LWWSHDDQGMLVVEGRLPPEQGAVVVQALEAAGRRLEAPQGAEPPPVAARRADALVEVAEAALAAGDASSSGGDRYQVVVHVEAETLRGEAGARSEIEDGPRVSAETARRLACDAGVVRMVEDEAGRVLDVGRKTRSVPAALRRALEARDGGCRFPGCEARRFVDAHHVEHWADGGETRLGNLLRLCRRHHRLVHEGGYSVSMDPDGQAEIRRPDGRVLEASPRLPVMLYDPLEIPHDPLPVWKGERLDYEYALEALMPAEVTPGRSTGMAAAAGGQRADREDRWTAAGVRA